jgi:hypothetical protein
MAQNPSMTTEVPVDHPYVEDLERERLRWEELAGLCASVAPPDRERHGYYRDGSAPDGEGWSVKELLAHIGTWLAQGKSRLERIRAGTYEREDMDIDALNARFLEAMHGQPWSVVWVQANAARTLLLSAWYELDVRTDDADWWLRKVGPDHYDEHLGRLRDWVAELRLEAER